jgi:plastocyanin
MKQPGLRSEFFQVPYVGTLILSVLALAVPHSGAADNASVTGTVTAKGLSTNANVVVSLQAPGLSAKPPAKPVEMDQKGKVFIPHVLAVLNGTTVRFLNSDAFAHNVFSPEGRYDLGSWQQGQTKEHAFTKPGAYTQLCRSHPEMEAFVVVLDTPYFTTTGSSGVFQIANVPPGRYTLVAWSEKLKEARQPIAVEAGKPTTVHLTLTR